MSYICDICDTRFDEPVRRRASCVILGQRLAYEEEFCPVCESPRFEKADRCTCNNTKLEEETMCRECRQEFARKVCRFFDALSPEELEQFDAWMDGESIENRRKWK